jgi:hypothetical protein
MTAPRPNVGGSRSASAGERSRPVRRRASALRRSARSVLRREVLPRLRALRVATCVRLRRRPVVDPHGQCDVMLTSHGPRLGKVHLAIESIAGGSRLPRSLTLAVDDERFVSRPPKAIRRQMARGLRLLSAPDHGPHTKYYPHVCRHREFHRPLVTADDDIFYPRTWLQQLEAAHRAHPGDIIAHRAHHIVVDDQIASYADWLRVCSTEASHLHLPTGVGGVLYPPAQLEALRAAGTAFVDVCLRNDDIWLHAIALRNGIRVRQVSDQPIRLRAIRRKDDVRLWGDNGPGGANDRWIVATYTDADVEQLQMEHKADRCDCALFDIPAL